MIGPNIRMNLLLSRKFKKEALEFASSYGANKYFRVCFNESDLTTYEPGNLIGQISTLSKEGFIRWDYKLNEAIDSNNNNNYQIVDISLTVEGEKLLKSYSLLEKTIPVLVGIVIGLLTTYCSIKFGLINP